LKAASIKHCIFKSQLIELKPVVTLVMKMAGMLIL